MHPNPVAVIIRNYATRQFQETQGILYIAQHGGKPHYTVVLEKENIDTAIAQKFVDNMSPLQAILEKQDKSRLQAESIADRIIEEIILQKSKKQMAEKLIKEQNHELQKLADDISMQNGMTDSRCLTTPINGNNNTNNLNIMHRQPSSQSIDIIKRSNSQLFRPINNNNPNSLFTSRSYITPVNQININPASTTAASQPYYFGGAPMMMMPSNSNQNLNNIPQNQFHQSATLPIPFTTTSNNNNNNNSVGGNIMQKRKNELIQSIGNQIERNIKEEQLIAMGGYFDTVSVSENSRFSPRAGSPQLQELRSINKSSKNLSPFNPSVSLMKGIDNTQANQDKLETEASAQSAINFNTFQLPNTSNPATTQQFYPSNKRAATVNSASSFDLKDYLKKAIMNKRQSFSGQTNIHPMNEQHLNGLNSLPGYNLAQQNPSPYLLTSLSHFDEQQPNTTKETYQSYGEQQQHEETIPALLKRKHAYSYSQNGGLKQDNFNNTLSLNQQQQQLQQQQQQHQQHLSTQESKFSQFKGMHAIKNDTNDDDLEDFSADIQQKLQSSLSPSHQKTISDLPISRMKSHENNNTSSGIGSTQVYDFVSKINQMLTKSASINIQVENSLQESEKNLQSMNLLSNLNLHSQQSSNTNTSL